MSIPKLVNPYNEQNKLIAFVGKESNVELSILNNPTGVMVLENFIGFSYSFLYDLNIIKISIVPKSEGSGNLKIILSNSEGEVTETIPYQFIKA